MKPIARLLLALSVLASAQPALADKPPLTIDQLRGRELECIAGLTMYGLFLDESAKDTARPDQERQERMQLGRKNDMQLFWFVGRVGSWPSERRNSAAFAAANNKLQAMDPDDTIALISGCGDWFTAEGLATLQNFAS